LQALGRGFEGGTRLMQFTTGRLSSFKSQALKKLASLVDVGEMLTVLVGVASDDFEGVELGI
jgi:hypothetical protein